MATRMAFSVTFKYFLGGPARKVSAAGLEDYMQQIPNSACSNFRELSAASFRGPRTVLLGKWREKCSWHFSKVFDDMWNVTSIVLEVGSQSYTEIKKKFRRDRFWHALETVGQCTVILGRGGGRLGDTHNICLGVPPRGLWGSGAPGGVKIWKGGKGSVKICLLKLR